MRVGYGWPKVISTVPDESESEASSHLGEIVGISSIQDYIVVAFETELQLWSAKKHRLRLACFTHAREALELEGRNARLATSPASQRIAVCTTRQCIHLYRLQHASKASALPPSLHSLAPSIHPADLVLTHSIDVSQHGSPSAIAADTHGITVSLRAGGALQLTWTGHVRGAPSLCPPACPCQTAVAAPAGSAAATFITQIIAHPDCPDSAIVYSDGSAAHCICDTNAQAPLMHAVHARWLVEPQGGALCGAIGARAQSIALGCADGVTRIWSATGGADTEPRELSLADWGHGIESTGAVACVVWTPDSEALAVGYERQGFAVWTASGCRVMSSLRHVPQRDANSDAFSAFGHGGVAAIAWDASALRLVACERGQPWQLLEMQFVRPAGVVSHLALPGERRGPHIPAVGDEVHVLQADDRLLFVTETMQRSHTAASGGGSGELSVHHAPLPHSYVSACWPVRTVSVAAGAVDIAVAGTHGFVLFDRRSGRWRMFGDVRQERAFHALRLALLSDAVAVCRQEAAQEGMQEVQGDGAGGRRADAHPEGACKVALYSRFFLDKSSILAEMPLLQAPLAMDTQQGHLLLAFAPLQLLQVRVDLHGRVRPSHTPKATLTTVRELNLLSLPRPIIAAALIANRFSPAGSSTSLHEGASLERPNSLLRQSTRLTGDPMSPRDAHGSFLVGRDGSEAVGSGQLGVDADAASAQRASLDTGGDDWRASAPSHCVVLRWGGLLTLIDLDSGVETHLFAGVECVWLCPWLSEGPFRSSGALWPGSGGRKSQEVPSSPSAVAPLPSADAMLARAGLSPRSTRRTSTLRRTGAAGTRIEMPWWIYSSQGMQLLFPSTLARFPSGFSALAAQGSAAAGPPHMHLDQELQFDREVFPIGVSLADAAIIGMSQRLHRAPYAAAQRPISQHPRKSGEHTDGRVGPREEPPHTFCLVPIPQSQPVLPCLLRRQLQHAHFRSARRLARLHQHGPHFSRSLEWLLFTSLDYDYTEGDLESVASGACDEDGEEDSVRPALLRAAFDLIRCFPQWRDVVVNVSRKTDAVMWPLLFAVVGKPSTLLQQLLRCGQVHTASCMLVVVDSVEGPEAAHALALALVEAAMQAYLSDLAAELLRFLDPAGETERDAFLEPHGVPPGAVGDMARQQHAVGSAPLEGPANDTPGTACAARDVPAGSQEQPVLLTEQSRLLQSEASAADTSGAPVTPPTLGSSPPHNSGGGQRSWLSFFFGYGELLPRQQDADAAQRGTLSGTAAARVSVSGSDSEASPAPGSTKAAAKGQPTDELPDRDDSVGAMRAQGGSAAVAMAARRLIAEYSWTWLGSGHLLRLADLQRALSLVPCSLAALMQVFPVAEPAGFTADDVFAAISTIRVEVPFDEQPALLSTAHDLLLLFHYIYAPPWRLAMAVCLDQQTHLQQMRQRAPKVWSEVRARLAAHESLRDLAANLRI